MTHPLLINNGNQYFSPRQSHSIACCASQGLFDAYELVVLGGAVAATHRAGLDLSCIYGNGNVGDRGVLGLARAVADDGGVATSAGQFYFLFLCAVSF